MRVRQRRTRRGWSLLEAEVGDQSGVLNVIWFNQPYLAELIRPGLSIFLHGEIKPPYGKRGHAVARFQMIAPEFELNAAEPDEGDEAAAAGIDPSGRASAGRTTAAGDEAPERQVSLHLGRIVPIYPTTKGLSQRYLRRLTHRAIETVGVDRPTGGAIQEAIPQAIPRDQAIRNIHFPESGEALTKARDRLIREEYFRFATRLIRRREFFREARGSRFLVTRELDEKIRSIFPFRFTPDQDRAVQEIVADLQGDVPMYRLLQGDVGSGKTAVALYSLLAAVRNRHQGAMMAPTEVLAEQHHHTISRYLKGHPAVRIALLTGSLPPLQKQEIQAGIAAGHYHIVLGTHALIQESVQFQKLGLAVIDEQHRFGVRERAALRKKGDSPHLLVMTATPIPRSLCLTAYGDLDLSLLLERPPGRKSVQTRLVSAKARPRIMEFIRNQLRMGRQAYFVYPLIDESEVLSVPAAVEAHRRLAAETFQEFSVGLLHGRMSAEEKDERLRRFREGTDQVLVATVVVEVGIDVPNATVLFLEDASRFGLAQLHQLRGRIGRGPDQSFCFVGMDTAGPDARERLKAFAGTEDGFRIAEEDLHLRGPGDFVGVRQAGWPDFVLGNPLQDLERFTEVRALAERFWKNPQNRLKFPEWVEPDPPAGGPGKGGDEEFLGLD